MKRLSALILAAILVLASAGTLCAQARSVIEVTRADIQSDRKAIVAANLPLSDVQAAGFWPIYREYRGEMDRIGDRTVKVMTDFVASYGEMTDEKATPMMTEFLAIQKDLLKVKEKYMPRFTKIMPAKHVLRFYQIENKLDNIVMMGITADIPLSK
jgi:hypothetical protein